MYMLWNFLFTKSPPFLNIMHIQTDIFHHAHRRLESSNQTIFNFYVSRSFSRCSFIRLANALSAFFIFFA